MHLFPVLFLTEIIISSLLFKNLFILNLCKEGSSYMEDLIKGENELDRELSI